MEKEDILKFINTVILLSKLFTTIEDRFLKQKLYGKLSDFVSAFVEQKDTHFHVSHNVGNLNLVSPINNLLDYLEHLAYTSKNNTTPLLVAQRNLLKFKLHILKLNKAKEVSKASDVPRPSDAVNLPLDIPMSASVAISKPSAKIKHARLALKPNSNKEQIFDYIKKTPDVRAKDIMNEFSVLSGRTVKRSLKELTDEGLLKKRSDGVAVYYLTVD